MKKMIQKYISQDLPKKKKKSVKQFLVNIVIGAVITFGTLAATDFYTVFRQGIDNQYYDLQIPYDVKDDFFKLRSYMLILEKLDGEGFEKDGVIFSFIKSLQTNVYERMIAKVPADDLIRVVFQYDYELRPLIKYNTTIDMDNRIDILLAALEKIKTLKSSSEFVDKYRRIIIADSIFSFFIAAKNENFFNENGRPWLDKVAEYTKYFADLAYKNKDALYHHNSTKFELYEITIISYNLLNWKIVIDHEINNIKVNCDAPTIRKMHVYLDLIPELEVSTRNIKNLDIHQSKLKVSAFNIYNNSYKDAKKFLKDRCNIETKYNHFPL